MESAKSVEVELLPEKEEELQIKAYRRRWIIMASYMYYACLSTLQWIEYSSITNIVVKYYNVSTLAVDWTGIVFMAAFPISIIPASIYMDKKGLRTTILIGCTGTFIGTGLKVFSIKPNLFYAVLFGQIIVALSQVFIYPLPSKLAAVWFKSNEISTACALGVFGSMFGNALGYIIPTMIVYDSQNMNDIASGLKQLCWILTILMVPVTIGVIIYFPEQPPLPPSTTEASRRSKAEIFDIIDFFHSLKNMFRNKGFLLHLVAFSINVGVSTAASTLLTQFVLQYFEEATEEAGRMGFIMVIAGLVAILLSGVIMDKTRKYKEIALISYLLFGISLVFLMFSLKYRSIIFTYISWGLLGFFNNGYMPVGFELAVELTFPAQEIILAGIIMTGSQVVGALLTVALGHLNSLLGTFWSLAIQAVLLFFGTLITAFIPNRMLRQEAINNENNGDKRKLSHSLK